MKKENFSVWFSRIVAVAVAGLAIARAQVEGPNGHYYKVVMEPNLLWEDAKARAAASTFNGVHGYLATITSAEEDQFIENLRQEAAPGGYGSLWVGGSQVGTSVAPTDSWYWVNGEGPIPTRDGGDGYSNWQSTEPNDYWGPGSEGYLSVGHFNTFGWNDEPNDRHILGYVVEYPSRGTTSAVAVKTEDPVAIETDSLAPPDYAVFVFSRTGDTTLDLPVFYSVHGTAVNGADYNEIAKSIVIPAGKSEVRLEIVAKLDALTVVEPMETVGIRLEPSQILTPTAAYYIDQNQREAGAVIYERQPPEKTSVEVAVPRSGFTYKVGEPVVILAARYSTQRVTMIDYYIDGQLLASVSDTEDTNVLNFFRLVWAEPTPGTHTVVAKAHGDTTARNSSTVQINVGEPAPQPTVVGIRFVEPTTTEPVPDADYAPGYLEVTRTGSTSANLQVFYSIGGTATAGSDYETLQGYVVIPAGKTAAKIIVAAIDDVIDESNETVVVTLVPPGDRPTMPDASTIYTVDSAHASAQVVILDNDDSADFPIVSVVATVDHTVESGVDAFGKFRISRTGPTTNSLNVAMTYEGTAIPDEDYRRLIATVTIPAGASSKEISVEPLNDQLVEGDETVIARITPLRGVLYNVDTNAPKATVTIRDDDAATGENVVRITTTDAIAREGAQTPDPATFEIFRSGSVTENLQVFFSIHGTAKNGEDYDTITESVIIPAGRGGIQVKINPKSDSGGSTTHKYEIVQQGGLTWQQAREQAATKTYEGVKGHLATITSAEEDQLIDQLRVEAGSQALWVGGFQEPTEMSITEGWKWVNNEGPIPGTNDGSGYANWLQGEPNDYWGPASENGMVIGWLSSFGWNDQGVNVGAAGYVVEFDVPVSSSVAEPMETVGLRLEPSSAANPLPGYTIDQSHRMAGAVILDGPIDGAVEIAIPSSGEVFQASDVEFLAEAYHPISQIFTVDFYVDDVKVGSSTVETPSTGGGVLEHRFKWATPVAGNHVLQAKATLGGGRVLVSSRIPFTVQGAVDTTSTVKVIASDPEATEFGPNADGFNPARFVISRDGSTAADLHVFFSLHGTAVNGEDYDEIDSPVVIPAGRSSIEIQVVPLSDGGTTTTHHYEIVPESGLSWEQARVEAEAMTFGGVKGHLATITSREEDELIESLRQDAGGLNLWVGGYQEPDNTSVTEGWKWVNNEGAIPGVNGSEEGYANWVPGEPNDYWGPGSENHLVIGWGAQFGWNDQTLNIPAQGYVVEFDVATPAPAETELMETVAIRLEPTRTTSHYKIDEIADSAAAVIFEGAAPVNGAIEIAIPSPGENFSAHDVEFVAAAYHPTLDSEVVEFYVDDLKVGQSEMNFERPTTGGVFEHHFVWTTPSNGQHVLQGKARLSDSVTLVSSRIPFVVNGSLNANPIAKVTKPAEGASLIEGDTIHAVASATDADGTIAKIEFLLDGTVIATAQGTVIEKDFTAAVGTHTLTARATDNAGAVGVSAPVHILVRHPDAVAFVHRELPAAYSPGVSFLVTLRANPPEGTFAYAIEDRPPTGWRVTDVSGDGAFDASTGKVKFGPFTDDLARTLTYRVTPPTTANGRYEFAGHGSVNGALYPITGDSSVILAQQFHPADSNQDLRIPLSELTGYAAAWKAGRSWPTGPVPIPLSYVTRAQYIWQHGEAYRFDPAAGAPPTCWIPVNDGPRLIAATVGGAQRSVLSDLRSGAAAQVRISAAPAGGSSGYAVEEKPPRGWIVSNISHDGAFDAASGTIRWGMFADATARTLTYTITPPPTVTSVGVFAGQISYDGKVFEIAAAGALANSVTIDGTSPTRISGLSTTATGSVTLNISGPAGQTAVLEGSTDFTDWTEVKSIFIPNGSVSCTDESGASGAKFYRLRVQ